MQSSAGPQEGPKIEHILHTKDRIFWITLLKNKEMVFKNGFKNIQVMNHNDVRTVIQHCSEMASLSDLTSGQSKNLKKESKLLTRAFQITYFILILV